MLKPKKGTGLEMTQGVGSIAWARLQASRDLSVFWGRVKGEQLHLGTMKFTLWSFPAPPLPKDFIL